jgi:hypothetical protein
MIDPARLAGLKRQAQDALHESAHGPGARAREELLQLYRESFFAHFRFDPIAAERRQPWSAKDAAAVEWLERLGASGHVGARHLLEQFVYGNRLDALHASSPKLLEKLAARYPHASSSLARLLCAKDDCDLKEVRRWLAAGRNSDRYLAAALDELDTLGLSLGAQELAFLRKRLSENDHWFALNYARSRVLLIAARHHEGTPAGMRALELAAEQGNEEAIDELFRLRSTAIADKARMLDAWFDAGGSRTHKIRVLCLRVGAEIERGADGMPGDLPRALKYYRVAVGGVIWREDLPDELHPEFCFDVAHAFDRNSQRCRVDDPELAARWHDRLKRAKSI